MSFSEASPLPRADARGPFGLSRSTAGENQASRGRVAGPEGPWDPSPARACARKTGKASVRNSLAGEVRVAVLVPSSLRPPAGRIEF